MSENINKVIDDNGGVLKGATAQMRNYIEVACRMTGVCAKHVMGHVHWGGTDSNGNKKMIGKGCDGKHSTANREHLSEEDMITFQRNVVWRETQLCFNMDIGCTDDKCNFTHSLEKLEIACKYRGMGTKPSISKYHAAKNAAKVEQISDEEEPEVNIDEVGAPPQQHLSVLEIDDELNTQECTKYIGNDLLTELCGGRSSSSVIVENPMLKTMKYEELRCEVLVDDGSVLPPCVCAWKECAPYTMISGEVICVCCSMRECPVCPLRMQKYKEQKMVKY